MIRSRGWRTAAMRRGGVPGPAGDAVPPSRRGGSDGPGSPGDAAGRRTRTAFTLVEVLVVVGIVAVLATLLIPAIGLMRKSANATATVHLMNNLATAVSTYLGQSPRLGDTAADFQSAPWAYLHRRWVAAGKDPLLEPVAKRYLSMADGTIANDPSAAVGFLDGFGNPIVFQIVEQTGLGGVVYARSVIIRSDGPDPGTPDDDITMALDVSTGNWKR